MQGAIQCLVKLLAQMYDRVKLTELTDLAKEISDAGERFAQDNLDQILTSITKLGRDGRVDHAAFRE